MEALQFTLTGVLSPNPSGKRAQRVKWCLKPQRSDSSEKIIAFGTQKNVVIKDLANPLSSILFADGIEGKVTCVKYSHSGYYLAFGDDKGMLKVIGWSAAENGWVTKYENSNLFGGAIADIAWSDDSKKIVAVGAGS